ncbi:4-hydroxythreonine-4-phosphate dehydrogenase PdxA [Kushneria phosphatilytica]|uniref:4-hydroxythreonine-4-phosphate dehydrogenase n=1 Tax=Kushneria phosphatilytica TaxID=657387 RepID=A0A1S1NT36_9GAMM|nr:4-hydroxythreonine-4-phosphate dehydrogenase PdxA [Kushneria phosphatilytica]OHV12739.1 4-hydroxythreonine-4-phosphate dehydrogenase PdxA [Kushneria phosphatilytica]QEL10580.1 4-hydroxythreonine-4-phosphate dehydrogenase PdxA [Kushneria phosphatilytica]
MTERSDSPVIALTPGEPAGIGPELVARLACEPYERPVRLVAVADPHLMRERARSIGLALEVIELAADEPVPALVSGQLAVWPIALREPSRAGVLNPVNADYVLETLRIAAHACLSGQAAAMVTAPIHKGAIIEAGHIGFTGHTEFLRDLCGVEEVVMMLATRLGESALRVALATTHLPLKEVSQALTPALLEHVLMLLDQDLRRHFGIDQPLVRVCGLNPHAGEAGHLGREEIDVIIPVLEKLRRKGLAVEGPLPADTLFTPHHLEGADAILAMYHDQGLPVLKHAGFGRAANITLGLPLIRTSVDHGTALDLAGTGQADPGSLHVALDMALEMVHASPAR